MSDSEENNNQNSSEELESAQENPKEIGSAESDLQLQSQQEIYEIKLQKTQVKMILKHQHRIFNIYFLLSKLFSSRSFRGKLSF